MNKYKTLVSNTMLLSFGTFGSKLLVFLMIRFYTGYLTPADYGTADLITQTANLLFPLVSFGITNAVFRFALDKDCNRKDVFSTGLLTITIGGLLFLVLAPLLGIAEIFKGYVWLIVLYTMASCYHSLCAQYLRAIGKTAFFAVQGIINTALVIVFNILFLAVLRIGIVGYVLSVALADIIASVIIILKEKLWKNVTIKPESTVSKKMLAYGIPMIPATIFWWVTSVSSRYLVTGFIGSDANGIYSVAYKLPTFLTLLSTVFMEAWQFSAVSESEGDTKEHINFYSTVWGSFQSFMFMVAAGLIAFCKPAISILTTKDYYSAWQYIPLLAGSMVFSSFANFMGSVYIVTKNSKNSFITSMVGAISNVVLSLILIPSPLGVQGAAIATFLSYFIMFIIRAVNAKKYIPFDLSVMNFTLNTLIICVQTVFMIFNLPLNILVQIIGITLIFAINFKHYKIIIEKFFSLLKRKKGA